MSEEERKLLIQRIKAAPNVITRWKRAAGEALVTWVVVAVLFVFAWTLIAWLAQKAIHKEIGPNSPAAKWILAIGVLGSGIYAIFSSVRWLQKWPDPRKAYQADLESGQVIEESYEFVAAKRFQEQEHGGLIYFLRTTNDKVFALWDYERQDLGVQNENPQDSKFKPMSNLLIVRAPQSEFVINKKFSGTILEAGEPYDMTIGPDSWPEDEAYCRIKWDDLEKRLNRKDRKTRKT